MSLNLADGRHENSPDGSLELQIIRAINEAGLGIQAALSVSPAETRGAFLGAVRTKLASIPVFRTNVFTRKLSEGSFSRTTRRIQGIPLVFYFFIFCLIFFSHSNTAGTSLNEICDVAADMGNEISSSGEPAARVYTVWLSDWRLGNTYSLMR